MTEIGAVALTNHNAILRRVSKQFNKMFNGEVKTGEEIKIRCPINPTLTTGRKASKQPAIMKSRAFKLGDYMSVDFVFEEAEENLEIENMAKNIILPSTNRIAGALAKGVMNEVSKFPNIIGNIQGKKLAPVTAEQFLDARSILADNGANMDGEVNCCVGHATNTRCPSLSKGKILSPVDDSI